MLLSESKILYLHGLDATPESDNVIVLQVDNVEIIAPYLEYREQHLFELISSIISKMHIDSIVGHSLGGYLAYYLSNKHQIPCLMFNPAFYSESTQLQPIPNYVKELPPYNNQIAVVGSEDEDVLPENQLKFLEATKCRIFIENINHDIPDDIKIKYFNKFIKQTVDSEKFKSGGQFGSILVYDKLYKDHHKVWDELDIIEKNICENTCVKYSKEVVLMWERELKNHFLEEERDLFPTIKNADNELAIHLLIEEHKIILPLIERIKIKNKKSDILAFCSYMKMHIKGEEELMNKFSPDPYKKGGEVLLAPNGKPSNLNSVQWHLVRSPEFKKWFGDFENDLENSSKVVDENQEPLIVYHGSNSLFNEFHTAGINNLAFFSDNKKVAKNYGKKVSQFFLNIKDLNSYNFNNKWWKDEYMLANKMVGQVNDGYYDGLLFENTKDPKVWEIEKEFPISNIYAIKNPNFIKLADGTNTTFDSSSPDIRLDDGGNLDNSKKTSKFIQDLINNKIQYDISGKNKIRKGAIIEAISRYVRRSQSTSSLAKGTKLYKKQEAEFLKSYITEHNLWISNISSKNYIGQGGEQKVYLIDADTVVKTNNAVFYGYCWEDYFNSLLMHNYFFDDTAYELIGFEENNGELSAVVKQPFIKATEKIDLGLVKKFMAENGFVNNKREDYKNYELGVILEDLHDENVLTKNGVLYFVDTFFSILYDSDKKLENGGVVNSDVEYRTATIILGDGEERNIGYDKLNCILEQVKNKNQDTNEYNKALLELAINKTKKMKNGGDILEDEFYYLGFFDKNTKLLKAVGRLRVDQIGEPVHTKMVDNATDKGMYIKYIPKTVHEDYSPFVEIYESDIEFKRGGSIEIPYIYIGFFDASGKLSATGRFKESDLLEQSFFDVVNQATKKGLYIKKINQTISENFSQFNDYYDGNKFTLEIIKP